MPGWKNRLKPGYSDTEALAAAAFPGDIRIAKLESLVQALFDKVDLRAINQTQAFLIDNHGNAAILENAIIFGDFVSIVDDIGEAIASGFLDAEPQPDTATPGLEMVPDPLCSRFCK